MNYSLRERGQEILRLRKALRKAEAQATPGMARPTTRSGTRARSVPSSPAEREAGEIRMLLLTAEMQYRELDGTDQYLQELGAEEEGEV
ncbi:MAG TPA: hypothetical protein VMV92_22165 [Streptosporangiaceae bacterium]|nr:hypothetical protein [Streptosporangiaceae bacterium]